MITVDLGDGVIREMDEKLLTPNHSVQENEHQRTVIREFKLMGRVVHHSVHVHLKKGIGIEGLLGKFS